MRDIYRFCQHNESFSADEVRYIAKIHSNILFLTDASVSELMTIIRNDQSELTDDERIKRLNGVYDELNDACGFVQALKSDVSILAMARAKVRHEDEVMQRNYNL